MDNTERESSGIYRIFHLITSVMALLISWFYNRSILWAIFHFICGWVYIIYAILTGLLKDGKYLEIINYYF